MPNLESIGSKIAARERLSADDALWMYLHAPSAWLQEQADAVRRRLHGEAAFYNRNVHFEPTNKCIYACRFCAFARKPEEGPETGAWDYTLADLKALLDSHPAPSLTEVHITGGVHPDRGVEFGEALCALVRDERPEIHVKAFTAVEIAYFARKSGLDIEQTLARLKNAGLASLPGGGAEIFDPEVRKRIAGQKSPAHRWLEIHETAHRLGIQSNATMLYGHVEEHSHRVDHMERLRDLQDRTGGFMAFIPLRYRNENNALSHLPEVSAEEDLRNYAVARLFLDNIPHLKAYWVMAGIKAAQMALWAGADDFDGTLVEERVGHAAGADTPKGLTAPQLRQAIVMAGFDPVERDARFRPVA